MANKAEPLKGKKRGPKPKLRKSDKDFYKKLGKRGGKKNRDNHATKGGNTSLHFRKLAILSHQIRRERRVQEELQAEAGGR
jgi:hypothetical protein